MKHLLDPEMFLSDKLDKKSPQKQLYHLNLQNKARHHISINHQHEFDQERLKIMNVTEDLKEF